MGKELTFALVRARSNITISLSKWVEGTVIHKSLNNGAADNMDV